MEEKLIEIGAQLFVIVPRGKEFSAFLTDGFGALGRVLKRRGNIAEICQRLESQIVAAAMKNRSISSDRSCTNSPPVASVSKVRPVSVQIPFDRRAKLRTASPI